MLIKYYGFNKEFLSSQNLIDNSYLPENINGFEIYDENGVLIKACFQGSIVDIESILDNSASALTLFPLTNQEQIKNYAIRCYKQNNTTEFIINVKSSSITKSRVTVFEINCPTYAYNTKEQLEEIFINIKNELILNNQLTLERKYYENN